MRRRLRSEKEGTRYCDAPVPRSCKLEPTADPPKDEPTEVSWRLEPIVEDPRLEPTVELEMLEPTVERWSEESTVEELSLFRVDSPIDGPALPVAPMSNPDGPLPPMSRLLLGEAPIS